jgi:hypothetical protein
VVDGVICEFQGIPEILRGIGLVLELNDDKPTPELHDRSLEAG